MFRNAKKDKPQTKNTSRGRDNRFPRCFKEVARILKEVITEHKSLKGSVYNSKYKGQVLKKIYGMANSVLTNLHCINYILQKIHWKEKEPHISHEVAQILIHEAVKKHPLPGKSYPVLAVQKYEANIQKFYSEFKCSNVKQNIPCIPKYARVHTISSTVQDVISALQSEGYKQLFEKDLNLSKHHEMVQNLKSGEFVQDYHFEDVLVFSKNENLTETSLYANRHFFLQDKASYIPSYVLNPGPGSIVLDCCAAPGMKTAHLACIMKNSGKLHAIEKDSKRFTVLQKTLKLGNIKNYTSSNRDFTSINPKKKPYSSVQYILLDPSCSGSGMVAQSAICDNTKNIDRIDKLTCFQISMLKHALSFPIVKRIVYSTCSIHEEENEYVIQECLKEFSETFEVVPVFPEWKTRGLNSYSFGEMCIRATPEASMTNGFFVAVINRI